MRRTFTYFGFAVMLAGCAAPRVDAPGRDDPQGCGAGRLAGWVGQPVSALDEQYLPASVRILAPGTPVTEDYSPSRLNVDVDAARIITGFHCG
jgi:hypothetical protein